MGVAKKPCSPSRIAEQNFLVYLWHQWNTMQLQNQRKLFLLFWPFWHKRPRTMKPYAKNLKSNAIMTLSFSLDAVVSSVGITKLGWADL